MKKIFFRWPWRKLRLHGVLFLNPICKKILHSQKPLFLHFGLFLKVFFMRIITGVQLNKCTVAASKLKCDILFLLLGHYEKATISHLCVDFHEKRQQCDSVPSKLCSVCFSIPVVWVWRRFVSQTFRRSGNLFETTLLFLQFLLVAIMQ